MIATQLAFNFVKERAMVAELEREPSRVICLGRSLIDLPTRFVTSYGQTYFAGWQINSRIEVTEAFNARLQQRLDGLKTAKNGYGQPSLEISKDPGGDWHGKILQFDRESLKTVDNGVVSYKEVVKLEGHLHAQGISFDISAGLNSETDLEELAQLIKKMRVRGQDEIPSESGFCFDRGIIVGKANPTLSEGITLFAGYPDSHDLAIVIDSTAVAKNLDTLLQRVAAIEERQKYPSSFKDLRIGARRINGYDGEEVLSRITERDGRTNHSFMWESTPGKEDIFQPLISMELSTGHSNVTERKRTPFTDSEALALWDHITSTLRSRSLD
jgi:hypothetical protein